MCAPVVFLYKAIDCAPQTIFSISTNTFVTSLHRRFWFKGFWASPKWWRVSLLIWLASVVLPPWPRPSYESVCAHVPLLILAGAAPFCSGAVACLRLRPSLNSSVFTRKPMEVCCHQNIGIFGCFFTTFAAYIALPFINVLLTLSIHIKFY